jgi:hypothetical protein
VAAGDGLEDVCEDGNEQVKENDLDDEPGANEFGVVPAEIGGIRGRKMRKDNVEKRKVVRVIGFSFNELLELRDCERIGCQKGIAGDVKIKE